MHYYITLEPDSNDTLFATCPALPECNSFGDDVDDALAHVLDSVETALADRIAERLDIPGPGRRRKAQYTLTLPTRVAAKVEIYKAMRAKGMRKADLARALNVQAVQIDRLLSLSHRTSLDSLDDAFRALGQTMTLNVSTAEVRVGREIRQKPRSAAKGTARRRAVA
jgi:antitoxin HicB